MNDAVEKFKELSKAFESIRDERRQNDAVRQGTNLGDHENAPRYITQEIYEGIMNKIYSMNQDMKIIWRIQVVLWGIVFYLLISRWTGL